MPASLFTTAAKNKPLVLYAHGINGFKDWGGMAQIAEAFAKNDFNFLTFNFSHNGTTVDNPDEFVDLATYAQDSYLKRQFDLAQVVAYVKQHFAAQVDIDRIYLIGHSRGGTDAILFASKNKDIKKVVSWAAPFEAKTPWGSWDMDKLKQWKEEGVIYRKNGRTEQNMPIAYALREEFIEHKANLDTYKAAQKLEHKPWLIVHGEADEAVFVKDAYTLKEYQPAAQVAIIPNTGHTFGRTHPGSNTKKLPKASVTLIEVTCDFLHQT